MPDQLGAVITAPLRELGDDVPVAVRSSATAEDLAYASFAGQQDTYLNIVGADALIDAVRRCWASLWTDRAVSYRTANGIDHGGVALAVVVQRMVDAAAAGVMFTANPVTGTRHETVIDASPGLGEAVVSGAVNPDHFVVDTSSGAILQRRLGDKRIMIKSVAGGGTEEVALDDRSDAACLTDDQLAALVDLGDGFKITTVRRRTPSGRSTMTGRPGSPRRGRSPRSIRCRPASMPGTRIFMCLTLAQGLTRPITPMGLASFRLIGASLARAAGRPLSDPRSGPSLMRTVGQRMFLDLTPVVSNAFGRRLVITVFGVMEARASAVLRTLADDPRFPIRSRSPLAVAGPVVKVAVLRAKVPLRLLTALVRPSAAPRVIARVERRLRASMSLPANATPEERLDLAENRLGTEVFLLMPTVFAYPAAGLLLVTRARRLLGDLAQPGELQTVLRGLPHNVTTEMDLELWQLTQRIRADHDSAQAFGDGSTAELTARYRNRTLPPAAQRGITAFLRRYGHRAVAEIDLGMPRWADDPSHIIGVIANYLRLEDPDLAPEVQFKRGEVAAESMIDDLVQRAARHSRPKARLVNFALRRARQLVGLRESPKYLLIVALGMLRDHLGKVGEALVERRAIDVPDDIYFLDYAEARRGLQGESMRTVVAERREAYAAELRRRHIPRLLLSDGTELEAVAGATRAAGRRDGRQPRVAGHGDRPGPGRARPGRRPPGARRDPGRAVDRSGLDAAVPDRRRSGDGDGRLEQPRRRGGSRVRHPGRGRRTRCDPQDRDRSAGHRRRRQPGWSRSKLRRRSPPPLSRHFARTHVAATASDLPRYATVTRTCKTGRSGQ